MLLSSVMTVAGGPVSSASGVAAARSAAHPPSTLQLTPSRHRLSPCVRHQRFVSGRRGGEVPFRPHDVPSFWTSVVANTGEVRVGTWDFDDSSGNYLDDIALSRLFKTIPMLEIDRVSRTAYDRCRETLAQKVGYSPTFRLSARRRE